MNLNEIGKTAHQINQANSWEVFHPSDWPQQPIVTGSKTLELQTTAERLRKVRFLCTHMALVHTEVAEATEAIRNVDGPNFAEELADVIIRVASIAHGLGINLEDQVAMKMDKNRGRGYRHGGKAV